MGILLQKKESTANHMSSAISDVPSKSVSMLGAGWVGGGGGGAVYPGVLISPAWAERQSARLRMVADEISFRVFIFVSRIYVRSGFPSGYKIGNPMQEVWLTRRIITA